MTARIVKNMPVYVPKAREGMSRAHLDIVKQCQCLGCGREAGGGYGIDPHHLMRVTATSRGMSMKNADRWAVPMCRSPFNPNGCHSHIEKNPNDDEWFAARGLDGRAVATALWSVREETVESYRRIIFRARQDAERKARGIG